MNNTNANAENTNNIFTANANEEDLRLSVKEYYNILRYCTEAMDDGDESELTVSMFADAAYHLAKANIEAFLPDDLLVDDYFDDGVSTPEDGNVVTSVAPTVGGEA